VVKRKPLFLLMLVCFARPTSYSVCAHIFFTEFQETIDGIRKILEGTAVKVDKDSEPPGLIETKVVEEPESKVTEDPEPEP